MTDRRVEEAAYRGWLAALEQRHLAQLTFSEVARGLRALSSAYVERRERLRRGAALDGGGKRAAFALRYGPVHFLTVRHVLQSLSAPAHVDTVVDLGCGTGVGGASWALFCGMRPQVVGIDCHHWAVAEAAWTYRAFRLRGRTVQADVLRARLPRRRTGIIAGWLVNELDDDARHHLRSRLVDAHRRGASVLVIEPIARTLSPWWEAWAEAFQLEGGDAREWRIDAELPDIVRRLDRAAGLSTSELTARSLWLPAAYTDQQKESRWR